MWTKSWKFWIMLASSLVGLVVLYVIYRRYQRRYDDQSQEQDLIDKVHDDPRAVSIAENYYTIKTVLNDEGYSDDTSKIICAQAMHETNYFQSEIYLGNNNYFGMRQPAQRVTTSKGDIGGYASYDSQIDSVKDLILWFKAKGDFDESAVPTVDLYVTYLKSKSYFTDTIANYKRGVSLAYRELETELSAG